MKKVKILFLVQLPPPIHGMSMINQYLFESKAIATEFETKFLDLALSKSISSIGRYSLSKFFNLIFFFAKLFLGLVYFRPKMVYFTLSPTGPALYRDAVICLLVKAFVRPMVIHMHGKGLKTIRQSSFKGRLVRWAFKGSCVISLSEGLKDDISELPILKKIALGNGIKKTEVIAKQTLIDRPVRLLFLSNLVKSKGILELMDSLSRLKKTITNWECRIVGSDGDVTTQEINKIIEEKGLKSQVTVLGAKYGSEKTKQLNWADMLVFPTYNDCFPLVILEAMMHSTAIVSTFEGAIPEIIENGRTGVLVDAHNVQKLTETMRFLIDNPVEISKMGRQAEQDFNEKFTFEVFERNLVSKLTECVSNFNVFR